MKKPIILMNFWIKEMVKIISFLALISSLNMKVCAQEIDSCTNDIKGRVIDADTKKVLPYVQIQIKETSLSTLTDLNGEFYFENLCQELNTLIISCFGYCDTTCENFYQDKNSLNIYLEQDILQLDSITISAKRSAKKIINSVPKEIIDGNKWSSNSTQTLASAISELEGVTFRSTGNNIQLPIIHGLSGNRILILNNGLKHGFQNWGMDHAPEIDISAIDKVTVLKGAAGVQYGPEALGGVLITEADPLHLKAPFKLRLGTGYQTNGKGSFINYKIGHGLKKWSYHLGANYTTIGDRHSPNYILTNTGKEEKSINGGFRYSFNDWDLKIYYSYINQHLALLRSSVAHSGNAFIRAINSHEPIIVKSFSYLLNQPNQLIHHHLGSAELVWNYSEKEKIIFKLGRQINKRKEFDVRRNINRPIIDLDLSTSDYQLDWKHPSWLRLNGIIGLQLFAQNNDNNPGTGTTPFIPNFNSIRYSGFIIEKFIFNNNTFEAGIRFDHIYNNIRGRETNQQLYKDEYSFNNLTSSLGFIHNISDLTTFKVNLGTAWRMPNMAELYSFGQHGFKTSFGLLRYYQNENNDLRTDRVITMKERDISPEKGYKWINEWQRKNKKSAYTLTAYSHYIENFIFTKPIGVFGTFRGPMPAFVMDQADALFIGTDFTWREKWFNSLIGTFGVSYLWSRDLSKNGPLINQAPISTNYHLMWQIQKFKVFNSVQFSIKPTYTLRQFQAPKTVLPQDLIDGSILVTPDSETFDFKDAPAGYFLLNIEWQFSLARLNINATIQNLLNSRYRNYTNDMRYFADELGRNIILSINYNF
jgi:iron complex outermembrane receptor protein